MLKNFYELERAQAWRSYLGGALLADFYGQRGEDTHYPEEWILSTVEAINAGRPRTNPPEGVSHVKGTGELLPDLLASDPEYMLGNRKNLGVLFKLIDSSIRLAIQVHPDKKIARDYFQSEYGKTECWHILGGRTINGEKPHIYFGFKPGVTRELWHDIFLRQDIPAMLDCLHKFEAVPGDTFLIEGGVPHAIGAGCFLAEIQEPTDYTLVTERVAPSGSPYSDFAMHKGIGFDKLFDVFHYDGLSREDTLRRWKLPQRGSLVVGTPETNCFDLHKKSATAPLSISPDGDFRGLFFLQGTGTVSDGHDTIPFRQGTELFLPAHAAPVTITPAAPAQFFDFGGPQ